MFQTLCLTLFIFLASWSVYVCPLSVFFRTLCAHCHQPVILSFPQFHPALSCLSEGLDVGLEQTYSQGGGWCSERTVMSGMWGGAVEGANVPKSCISFGVETSHFDFFQHHFCTASVHLTIFQKHKRKSSFVSSGKRYSLVGISFHCPRTICLLKQEDQRAKTHFEETLRFLRTDSVWICQLFCNLATVCSTKGTFHEKIPTLSVC